MKSRKQVLLDNITEYLKECVEAAKDLCGEDDDINYAPAKKAFDEMNELKEILEVTA
jgi:hypothetical protein